MELKSLEGEACRSERTLWFLVGQGLESQFVIHFLFFLNYHIVYVEVV